MPTPRGQPFTSLDAVAALAADGGYFWLHDRTVHASWVTSWQFSMVKAYVTTGQLYNALPTETLLP